MIRWIIFLVIVIMGLVGVFYFIGNDTIGNNPDPVVKFVVESECAVCGNDCVILEFAKRAGCLAPTEDFGCKFDGNDCYRVDEGKNCKFTKDINYVCGVDGKTYTNPSFADCDGVKIDYIGKCGENVFGDVCNVDSDCVQKPVGYCCGGYEASFNECFFKNDEPPTVSCVGEELPCNQGDRAPLVGCACEASKCVGVY